MDSGTPGGFPTAANLFRREAGRMVAILTRLFGAANLEVAEDAVQETLLQAMETWKANGLPANPEAWLFSVARNKAIDVIRRQRHTVRFDFSDGDRVLLDSEYTLEAKVEALWGESSIDDDMLGMMFACCHPALGGESQMALVLKTLCGFTTAGIAQAFLTSEETVSKRLYRAKAFFRKERIRPGIPPEGELKERLGMVLHCIYLLFSEGYHSSQGHPVRDGFLDDALSLGKLLADHSHIRDARVCALMALMCFHASRSESRLSPGGDLVLLPDQDRGTWDRRLIREGAEYLDRASWGEAMTAYHLEAAIAWEHCKAASFAETDWVRILRYYQWLCRLSPGPMAELNRIIVVMQVSGPGAALAELEALAGREDLGKLTLYHAVSGEIHAELGNAERAREAYACAAALTRSEAERKVLREKEARQGPPPSRA